MKFEKLDCIDPSSCISSKVMRINRITANIFRKHLLPFNITNSQLSLLFIFAKVGGMTQKDLSDMVKLEKSSINRNINRLIDANYLSKEDFPIIKITHEGKVLANEIVPAWENAMSEIRQILGGDGEEALDLLLTKLLKTKI